METAGNPCIYGPGLDQPEAIVAIAGVRKPGRESTKTP